MLAVGVGQPHRYAWRGNWSLRSLPSLCATIPGVSFQSRVVGVVHPDKQAAAAKSGPWFLIASSNPPSKVLTPLSASAAVGVGHPVRSVADVRSTEARRRERDSPEGIVHGFHVSLYKVEPRLCILACNLFSKDDWRLALADEPIEVRPEVPLVIKPISLACRGERLARTGTGPNRSIVWPAGAAKGVGPNADAGEEVALGVRLEVIRVNILDRAFVNVAWRNVARGNQIAEPLRGVWVDFVVIRGHAAPRRGGVIVE